MEKITKNTFDPSVYNPALFTAYKIIKKVIKYTLYAAILYFAFEGFMAWE